VDPIEGISTAMGPILFRWIAPTTISETFSIEPR
jgi:hypothetical protein